MLTKIQGHDYTECSISFYGKVLQLHNLTIRFLQVEVSISCNREVQTHCHKSINRDDVNYLSVNTYTYIYVGDLKIDMHMSPALC